MKTFVCVILVATTIFFGCNPAEKEENSISKRDFSITKKNAYNDLFLDSSEVANYIEKNQIPDSIARRMTSFYNARNYEYAWFSSRGLSEQAMGFSSLLNFTGDTSAKENKLQQTIDNFKGTDNLTISNHNKSAIKTELQLTESLIEYSLTNFKKGYVKRKQLERFIPFKKENALQLADSLINDKQRDDKYYADINPSYKLLSGQLKKYVEIAKAGGWPAIDSLEKRKLKKNHRYPEIVSIKKLLLATGDLSQTDTSDLYDESFENGVKNFQTRFGFTADGIIGKQALKQMSVPVIDRIKQIMINMNRMRWLPQNPPGQLIEVNIPAFLLHVYDNGKTVFSMPVVVGKDAHSTTIFSDLLTTIVFSPYWNIPRSIVKNEIIPGMDSDKNYLDEHNMEITGEENGLPVVRQKPGDQNSLGKVKFLFPNTFNIYFHDTPAKGLFNKDIRAYSHGCIRLADAEKMADYLLRDNSKWTPQKIHEAMNSGNQQFVKLKDPVPVFITYYTAWVDENGTLNFRDDIYGHDKEVAEKMFTK
ncbi:MAG TPA: L,D-transpeptidase family protein [Hanamia sp.]|nr:L,D-transpeptidase family protein [Hanamia sp.]